MRPPLWPPRRSVAAVAAAGRASRLRAARFHDVGARRSGLSAAQWRRRARAYAAGGEPTVTALGRLSRRRCPGGALLPPGSLRVVASGIVCVPRSRSAASVEAGADVPPPVGRQNDYGTNGTAEDPSHEPDEGSSLRDSSPPSLPLSWGSSRPLEQPPTPHQAPSISGAERKDSPGVWS
ncbi:unnamed protein product [Arctogadus glacialis]